MLFYPNTVNSETNEPFVIRIQDMLAGESEIKIKVCQIPILNSEIINHTFTPKAALNEMFSETKVFLKERITDNLEINEEEKRTPPHQTESASRAHKFL